jgi:hypothetical protein
MGLYTFELKCGCVEVTSTLEKEAKTFTLSYCKEHTPREGQVPQPKKSEESKTEKSKNQKDPIK